MKIILDNTEIMHIIIYIGHTQGYTHTNTHTRIYTNRRIYKQIQRSSRNE